MKKNAVILLIIGWSLLVHIPGLTSPLLDYHAHRQCQTASMARDYYRDGMHFFTPETDTAGPPLWTGTEFPIYSYLLALLYKLFGVHEILGRLLSCFFTAWSAIFLYKLVRRRLGDSVGLWSALAMCTIPVHIYFTRTVQPESMALWGFIGFVYLLDRWLAGEGRPYYLPALVVLGALGPLLKLPFLYLVGGMWLVLGLEKGPLAVIPAKAGIQNTDGLAPGFRRGDGYYWIILPVIVGLTLAWYHYTRLAPSQLLPLGMAEHWHNMRVVFQKDFWEAHFISRFPEICTTYTGLLLGLIGVRAIPRQQRSFFFSWWLVTAAYTVLLGEYGWIHKYTGIPWGPINGVFIGMGIVAAWQWTNSRAGKRVLVTILIIGIPLHAALRIKHWYRLERLWLFSAQRTLARVSQPTDLVLTNTAEVPVLLYYLNRNGYVVNLESASAQEFESFLKRSRFFVTPMEGSWIRNASWASQLKKRGRLVEETSEYQIYEIKPS